MLVHVVADYGPAARVVFHNVAPRRDEANPRRANEGERFTAAEAPNGTLVVGPNAGHSLSFLRDEAPLFYLDVSAAGSQFRSRDFLPAAVGRLVAGDRGAIGEAVPSELVAHVPPAVVAYTDGYGNLKTTLAQRAALAGAVPAGRKRLRPPRPPTGRNADRRQPYVAGRVDARARREASARPSHRLDVRGRRLTQDSEEILR